jgi:hypothetical protein
MASQGGILGLRGTVAGLVFAKDGTVRQKPGSNKAKFKSAASMARVRENTAEFSTAGSAGKLLREALRSAIQGSKDRLMVSRLTKLMRAVIQRDATNGRGLRKVLKANAVTQFPGFEFNAGSPLGSTVFVPYSVSRAGGAITVDIPTLTPTLDLIAPQGATHYELVFAAAAIDFVAGTYDAAEPGPTTGIGVLNGSTVTDAGVTLTLAAAPSATAVSVAVLGVNYFQQVNGVQYALNNNGTNPLAIIFVN